MTREPDRSYDAGHDLWKRLQGQGTSNQIGLLIAALRAEREDGARDARSDAYDVIRSHIKSPLADVMIRAVASPAAAPAAVLTDAERDAFYAGLPLPAPAAEIGTCANFWHPGHGKEIHTRREAVGDVSAVHADYVNDSGCINWRPAPPSEPAAQQAGEAGGAAAPCNPRSTRSPATATGVEQRHLPAPAPLLPRVLAALEQEASAHDDFDSTYEHAAALALRALAAELRAYIAEMEGKT